MSQPAIGVIVYYTLTEDDAALINRRRDNYRAFCAKLTTTPPPGEPGNNGHTAHVGNQVAAGQSYPAIVVRRLTPTVANLQVYLDGNDTLWATSCAQGDAPGEWSWLPRN